MSTVIKVENLSKQYRLGDVGTGTLSHDLKRWWYKARGKEDPYLQIGETNDRSIKGGSDYVWALKDINFEVKAGEVLGIIGRNGAGKSTLLKILSKTTTPTTGSVKVKGRIASLLEVGTGFHPELTGRENIFLNGAILGMTKSDIQKKFDEIVDFSGIERYIDTPVKRYSSGMYVRLAFGVAAHLEPEILVVDEVLAVGDAEFQKKCLGKMKDVSLNEGRTVLFVSHNMSSINNLCNKGLLLNNGSVEFRGNIHQVVEKYFDFQYNQFEKPSIQNYRTYDIANSPIYFTNIFVNGFETNLPKVALGEIVTICLRIYCTKPVKNASVLVMFFDAEGSKTDFAYSWDDSFFLNIEQQGTFEVSFTPSVQNLSPGKYTVAAGLSQSFNTVAWDGINYMPIFEVENKAQVIYWEDRPWAVHHSSNNKWQCVKIN